MRCALLAVVVAACGRAAPAEPPPAPGPFEDVRRVVAALDDVAGEYPVAAAAPARATPLDALLHDAEIYAARFPDDERAALHEIAASVRARGPDAAVVAPARALRRELLARHQVTLGPAGPAPRARAEQLWRSQCTGCHGAIGAGDGPQGLGLTPEPKDFHEPDFMATLSPTRAFSRITDGVRGTAMPAWGTFTTEERWGLAFLVFSFRHDAEAIARGRVAIAALGVPSSPTALADRSDGELVAMLRDRGLDDATAADALAYLRGAAPFEPPAGPFAAARVALADAYAAAAVDHADEARAAFARAAAAVAPPLAAVRGRDPELARAIDRRLDALGGVIDRREIAERVEREVARTDALLDRAEAAVVAPRVLGAIAFALVFTRSAASPARRTSGSTP